MPSPDSKPENLPPNDLARQVMARAMEREQQSGLAYEVAELRREIQALRQDLSPVPSLILTGRAALDEFKRLTQGA
jgi:hypothetical protein